MPMLSNSYLSEYKILGEILRRSCKFVVLCKYYIEMLYEKNTMASSHVELND